MKKEITYCDICKLEKEIKTESIPVIFTTDQTEGRSCKPYLCISKIDICDECKNKVLNSVFIYGTGAQGFNNYEFKGQHEIDKLRLFKESTIGLWATDRPDLLTDEEKEKCFMFRIDG